MKASQADAFILVLGGDEMTMDEASRQYCIPIRILREYEGWGLCGAVKKVMGAWQYDDTDVERLSTIMTLHDIGFTSQEVETYMRLLLEQEGTDRARLRMLDEKRRAALDDIHFREKQLERLDYLRHELRKRTEEPEKQENTPRPAFFSSILFALPIVFFKFAAPNHLQN